MMVVVVMMTTTRMVMIIETAIISVYSNIRMCVHKLKIHNVLLNVKQKSFYFSHCFVCLLTVKQDLSESRLYKSIIQLSKLLIQMQHRYIVY
jgi:hypothetical protein